MIVITPPLTQPAEYSHFCAPKRRHTPCLSPGSDPGRGPGRTIRGQTPHRCGCDRRGSDPGGHIVVTLVVSFWVIAGAAIVAAAIGVVASGLRIIGEDEAGLVIKRLGGTLPAGRLVALEGEAGFQAALLTPGWHFGYWHWRLQGAAGPARARSRRARSRSSSPRTAPRCRPDRILGVRSPATASRTRKRSCAAAASAVASSASSPRVATASTRRSSRW